MGSTSAIALDFFEKFCSANSIDSIFAHFNNLCEIIELESSKFPNFIAILKKYLTSADARELLSKYEQKANQKYYDNGLACQNSNVLIIGAGPCGLRTAIEAQLLGARVVIIEKRESFTRNNVLHLWPFTITDLRNLGTKRFCPKFCSGSIDHVSISQLQLILLKIALLVGVEVFTGIEFVKLAEPSDIEQHGWKAITNVSDSHPIQDYEFDVLIGADGKQNILPYFRQKELRGKLAIGITANFVNRRTAAEAKVQEISGVSSIFRQSFFQNLYEDTGIDLENIVYYKDDTHYFVMTAKKQSLLWKGVLKENLADTSDLLAPQNVDIDALKDYVVEAVRYSTEDKIPNLEFAVNYKGVQDIAIFDFTRMNAAKNACRVLEREGYRLLLGLVGDALLEPFWPTGSGCARGFLSALDAAWMIRSWSQGNDVLDVISERETIYRLLAQTTPENLNKDHKNYTVDPTTRYPNLVKGSVLPHQIKFLYSCGEEACSDSDEQICVKPSSDFDDKKMKQDAESFQVVHSPQINVPSQQNVMYTASSYINEKKKVPVELNVDFLVDWFRQIVQDFGIDVSGIHGILVHGEVLCATLHHFRPDLIPEYPFPPEVEEGVDISDVPAFRNQIAFDFLWEEYGLPQVVSGYNSVQYTITHLEDLIFYLYDVYKIFKDENLSSTEKSHHSASSDASTSQLRHSAATSESDLQNYEATEGKKVNPGIENLQKQFEASSTIGSKYRSKDIRIKEANECKLKAMNLMSKIQERRNEIEKEEIAERRNRITKAIHSIHINDCDRNEKSSQATAKASDDFFNEYNLRLWRKSAPSMEERKGKLENAFDSTKTNKRTEIQKPPRRFNSTDSLTSSKVNTSDWVLELVSEKFPGTASQKKSSGKATARSKASPSRTDKTSDELHPPHQSTKIRNPKDLRKERSPINIDFNEDDENLLDMLDPSELEHLEAWTGKYL